VVDNRVCRLDQCQWMNGNRPSVVNDLEVEVRE
jgi:hypothetical protein